MHDGIEFRTVNSDILQGSGIEPSKLSVRPGTL